MKDGDIDKILKALPPEQEAKLRKYMEGHPEGEVVSVPEAKATGELKLWLDNGDLMSVSLDRRDVWLLLYAIEQVQEAGPFDEEEYAKRYATLANKIFEAYRNTL
jgi:hypothetical protein